MMYKKMRNYFISFVFLLLVLSCFSQGVMSPRIANYKMYVDLDVANKKLNGKTVLNWTYTGSSPTDYVLFHMYYNAFKNTETTFFKERGGVPSFLTQGIDEECGWGWTEIKYIEDGNGNDLTANIHYVQTDDNNVNDQTVLKVPLSDKLKEGDMLTLVYNWEAKIPKTMPRTGYNKDFYHFAQWFPKVGVFEPKGMRYAVSDQWNCHQYHSEGEYYADFGTYEVNITLPSEMNVASSGQLINKIYNNELTTWQWRVNDVIDFAWTASEHLVVQEERYKQTSIMYYSYPNKSYLADRYFNTLKYCMTYLEEHLGSYPYPTISVIDPPIHGIYTGGMEYPCLITSLSFGLFPDGFKTPETLVVHEFIHQYFMQMVATHEVEEPWMDEGLTTYWEGRILDAMMGDKRSMIDFAGICIGNREYNRMEFMNSDNPYVASNARKSWQYKHGGYGVISYNKTAVWLQTLERLLGLDVMNNIMKSYFDQWKFKHPARQDFINVANEVVSRTHGDVYPDGLDWYFDQVITGTDLCDYFVASIDNELLVDSRGYFGEDNCEIISQQVDDLYKSTVVLNRNGNLKLPVEIVIKYDDASRDTFYWDGIERSSEVFVVNEKKKIIEATIDPNQKILLDTNLLNNSFSIQNDTGPIKQFMARAVTAYQNIIESILFFI